MDFVWQHISITISQLRHANVILAFVRREGLFAKAILMSGSALHPMILAKDPDNYARYLAKSVNCPNYEGAMLVDCLRTKSVEELLKVESTSNNKREAFDASLGPIIDGLAVPADPRLIMVSPNDSLQHHLDNIYHTARQFGQLSRRPHHLLFGVTRVESPQGLFTELEERQGIDVERRDHILRTLVRAAVDYYQEVGRQRGDN